jgi:hypothetical protein
MDEFTDALRKALSAEELKGMVRGVYCGAATLGLGTSSSMKANDDQDFVSLK